MERTPLVRAQDRVRSMINPKNLDVRRFRNILMGNVLNSTVGEICAYKMLFEDVKGGELPSYVPVNKLIGQLQKQRPYRDAIFLLGLLLTLHPSFAIWQLLTIFHGNWMLPSWDILIVAMSALEAIVVPFVSWLGFRKRRFVLVTYTLVALLSTISLYFLPSATTREESEFCDAANSKNDISYQGMSARSIVRLTIIITVTLTFQLSRISSWTHGLAYCDEYAPERISVHYGALLLGRVITLMVGNRMVTVSHIGLHIQISLLVLGYLCNLLQFFCVMPKHTPEVNGIQSTELPLDGRGLPLSMSRVVSRSLVLAMALATSLLAAGLWGIGYNRNEIVKVKFLMPASTSFSFDLALRHAFIVMPIALAGVKFSAPVLMEYCRKKALKQAVVMTTFAFIFFVLFTVVPKCDQGSVVGLGDNHYNYPECSLSCGCKPKSMEFNPVCVTDNMTTFLSPCHAGCSGTENFNGIQVYTRCRCSGAAGAGGALPGACAADCYQQYILHDMLFIVATTFTLLAFQAQGVLILKVVDPRDRSVAMGFMLAMVAVVTFVCGHLMFWAIRVATCRWHEGGECHLQTTKFPYMVGFCSSFFVLLSAIISIASLVFTRMYDKNNFHESNMSSLD